MVSQLLRGGAFVGRHDGVEDGIEGDEVLGRDDGRSVVGDLDLGAPKLYQLTF